MEYLKIEIEYETLNKNDGLPGILGMLCNMVFF